MASILGASAPLWRVVRCAALAAGLLCLLACLSQWSVAAEQALAPLTGRVVDDADLLSAASASALESKLRALEDKSGIQLVVATVKSLGGEEIEPYANRLFRISKLGDQKKNNGALLLVAPTEHRARIEVGYGLEGTLTDALSKLIITNAMVPRFKSGDFQGGIEKGVDDIIAVLSTDQSEWSKREDLQDQTNAGIDGELMIALIVIGVIVVFFVMSRRGWRRPGGMVFVPTPGSTWGPDTSSGSGSGGGGSSDDNSLSGGGGSSGGGGASGSW